METSYTNPVYPHGAADPFVMYFNGAFWCYHTGGLPDKSVFGILRSTDLIHWERVGGAMQPLPEAPQFIHYWAPEVTYDQGTFYLYYSTGDEVHMQVRVATSSQPEGPFVDSGRRITHEQFAIDAHIFTGQDGSRWMFYATDFLERERVGTSTVMDRMLDPFTLAGSPSPVSLAQFDWQIYDPKRKEKGNARWHTIEGPFVLTHQGRYYQMFSGGNYHNISYGVGYALTQDVQRREEWRQVADGVHTFPVLRTVPGHVYGPGHNSVVIGPDHRQMFCCYHVIKTYEPLERILAVDRMEWVGDRLVVLGPTYTPQPAPVRASPLEKYTQQGRWNIDRAARLFQGQGQISFPLEHPSFLFQVYAGGVPAGAEVGGYAIALHSPSAPPLSVACDAQSGRLVIQQRGQEKAAVPLPANFQPGAPHRFLVEVDGLRASVRMDPEIGGASACAWAGRLEAPLDQLILEGEAPGVLFSAAEISYGYEEWFQEDDRTAGLEEWSVESGDWRIQAGVLTADGTAGQPGRASRGPALADFEWVVNLRLARGTGLSLFPEASEKGMGPAIRLETAGSSVLRIGEETVPLPAAVNLAEFQQLRVWKQAGRMRISLQEQVLGEWPACTTATRVGMGVDEGGCAEFELIRVTALH